MNSKKWGNFKICDIFDIVLSTGDNQADMLKSGKTPLVSSGMNNNGVCKYIKHGDEKSKIFNENTITVDMFGKTFYHCYKYFAVSHGRVNILIPKKQINSEIGLFLVAVIEKSILGKYSYNRMCCQSRLENQVIRLPVTDNKQPDYEYMQSFIKEEKEKMLQRNKIKILEKVKYWDTLNISFNQGIKWKEFYIKDIFNIISRGKRLKKEDHIIGNIPYVSSTMSSNGVDSFIGNENGRVFTECLSLANSGSVGSCFYHEYTYIGSDHITALKNEKYNKWIYLFLATSIARIRSKYSFNREINDSRIKKERIVLPINSKGEIDFSYMENYMKKITMDKLKKYMKYKKIR